MANFKNCSHEFSNKTNILQNQKKKVIRVYLLSAGQKESDEEQELCFLEHHAAN
jgi:hypothetical protein